VSALGQRHLDGIGRQAGPLRPDYGPDWAELACDQCSATWVGRIGDPCDWCEKALERMQREKGIDLSWPEPEPLGDPTESTPFPLEALPQWMADHVAQVADELQLTPDLPAMLGLAALSICCARRATVVVQGTWREPLCLYLVVAAAPGEGKSPAVRQMLGCLDRYEKDLVERSAADRDNARIRRMILEKEQAKAVSSGNMAEAMAAADELRAIPEPVAPRLMADDVLPEKLSEMIAEQGGRMALISTEGGVFGLMAGRYNDKTNLDVYLKAWSGDPMRIDRMTRKAAGVVLEPTLTVGLTVQCRLPHHEPRPPHRRHDRRSLRGQHPHPRRADGRRLTRRCRPPRRRSTRRLLRLAPEHGGPMPARKRPASHGRVGDQARLLGGPPRRAARPRRRTRQGGRRDDGPGHHDRPLVGSARTDRVPDVG
jgi:hypothetical protein